RWAVANFAPKTWHTAGTSKASGSSTRSAERAVGVRRTASRVKRDRRRRNRRRRESRDQIRNQSLLGASICTEQALDICARQVTTRSGLENLPLGFRTAKQRQD